MQFFSVHLFINKSKKEMNVIKNDVAWGARSELLQAREQEAAVVKELTRMVKAILSSEGGMRWIGSKTDLLEMLKVVSDKGGIVLDDGRVAGFAGLVERTFGVFGLRRVTNPYSVVQRASGRKGVRGSSVMDRLRRVMFMMDGCDMGAFWNTLIIRQV